MQEAMTQIVARLDDQARRYQTVNISLDEWQSVRAYLAMREEQVEAAWPAAAEFVYGQQVEKFTGEATWHGKVVSAYLTTKGKLRYVVDVEPQGFQMIAVPSQLRPAAPVKAEECELDAIAQEARRYAGFYPEASDGRNTFIIFAEWVEARAKAKGGCAHG